jgi:hypothetical protein
LTATHSQQLEPWKALSSSLPSALTTPKASRVALSLHNFCLALFKQTQHRLSFTSFKPYPIPTDESYPVPIHPTAALFLPGYCCQTSSISSGLDSATLLDSTFVICLLLAMDSMRSLNTSLPAAYSSRQAPPVQLLQAFQDAARSVTNLYKSAVTDQNNSRAAGYQDALDDLMKFLDQENLGLQDGEGWRVRQWVSERFDGTANHPPTEAEEERSDIEPRAQSAPPSGVQVESQNAQHARASTEDDTDNQLPSSQPSEMESQRPVFTFTAGSAGPTINETDNDRPSQPIRVEVVNRGLRTPRGQRYGARRDFSMAGTKRKMQFPDFFDLTNLGDGEGGSKRGRFA